MKMPDTRYRIDGHLVPATRLTRIALEGLRWELSVPLRSGWQAESDDASIWLLISGARRPGGCGHTPHTLHGSTCHASTCTSSIGSLKLIDILASLENVVLRKGKTWRSPFLGRRKLQLDRTTRQPFSSNLCVFPQAVGGHMALGLVTIEMHSIS